jgi:hypothetical protein
MPGSKLFVIVDMDLMLIIPHDEKAAAFISWNALWSAGS